MSEADKNQVEDSAENKDEGKTSTENQFEESQITGTNKEIMSVENIAKKWESFNWDVIELDGHDI